MKKLFLAAALIVMPSLVLAGAPSPKSSITTQTQAAPEQNPCADPFSTAVKDDMLKGVDKGSESQVLKDFLGDEVLIMQVRGYCQAREAENLGQTPEQFAATLAAELKAEADKYGLKITYTSKITKVLGGSRLATVITPSADKIAQDGVDYRILTVFVFNGTRIVGIQLFTSVTGLKQP